MTFLGFSQKENSDFEVYAGIGSIVAFDDINSGLGPLLDVGVDYAFRPKWRAGLAYTINYYSFEYIPNGGDSSNASTDATIVLFDRSFTQAYNQDLYGTISYKLDYGFNLVARLSILNFRSKQEIVSLNGLNLRNNESTRFLVGYHYDLGVGWRINHFGINCTYSFVHRSNLQKLFFKFSYFF